MYSASLSEWYKKGRPMPKQSIELKRLNGLNPSIDSCTKKLYEEMGELMQLLGKGRKESGEGSGIFEDETEFNIHIALEALDLAQASVTMAYAVCDYYGIIIEDVAKAHEEKLRERGYLK